MMDNSKRQVTEKGRNIMADLTLSSVLPRIFLVVFASAYRVASNNGA